MEWFSVQQLQSGEGEKVPSTTLINVRSIHVYLHQCKCLLLPETAFGSLGTGKTRPRVLDKCSLSSLGWCLAYRSLTVLLVCPLRVWLCIIFFSLQLKFPSICANKNKKNKKTNVYYTSTILHVQTVVRPFTKIFTSARNHCIIDVQRWCWAC
jgi:hypothetical protein